MSQPTEKPRKLLFILDPLILHKEGKALFAFGDHNVFISASAIEEIDREAKNPAGKEGSQLALQQIEAMVIAHNLVTEGRAAYCGIDLGLCSAPGGASGKLYIGRFYSAEDRETPSAIIHDAIESAKSQMIRICHVEADMRFVSDRPAWRILASTHGVFGLSLEDAKELVGASHNIQILAKA